jgi:hypothetical protein
MTYMKLTSHTKLWQRGEQEVQFMWKKLVFACVSWKWKSMRTTPWTCTWEFQYCSYKLRKKVRLNCFGAHRIRALERQFKGSFRASATKLWRWASRPSAHLPRCWARLLPDPYFVLSLSNPYCRPPRHSVHTVVSIAKKLPWTGTYYWILPPMHPFLVQTWHPT